MQVTFEEWTRNREISTLGTNSGASVLPFQAWQRFKEAFAPELVERAVRGSKVAVRSCLDPFAGSGTTPLACQFLGVHPIAVEVSPYLADLIEAKLTSYQPDALMHDLAEVARASHHAKSDVEQHFFAAPRTFVEPGVGRRWIFDRPVAERVVALLETIEELTNRDHRRLFRVLLGGTLMEVSNVVVNGKGRRYRRGWPSRDRPVASVDELFVRSVNRAIEDVRRFSARRELSFQVLRGDSRSLLTEVETADLVVFSPPYPNSFDYTDIYNVELWTLGYLKDSLSNRDLRSSTLSSHVQIARTFAPRPEGSPTLDHTLRQLVSKRSGLWNPRIPEMVGAYFRDLLDVLDEVNRLLSPGGSAWMVVGDSRYGGTQVAVADILAELLPQRRWRVESCEPFRSMRASAQQGGRKELGENLLVITPTR